LARDDLLVQLDWLKGNLGARLGLFYFYLLLLLLLLLFSLAPKQKHFFLPFVCCFLCAPRDRSHVNK